MAIETHFSSAVAQVRSIQQSTPAENEMTLAGKPVVGVSVSFDKIHLQL
jgi:hypothetical protein